MEYTTARVANAEDAGNSGAHQFGFTRYARVILDNGTVIPRWNWLTRFPEEGDQIQVPAPMGRREELAPYVPSARRVMEWLRGGAPYFGCVCEAQALLGVSSQEFYAVPEWDRRVRED